MKLAHQELGEGEPIIIFHGLFGSSDNWLSIAKELAGNYKVYLPDLRNHGDSPHSEDFDYTAMAEDIGLFLKDHQIEKPVIVGHSMGGKAAMKFAVANPNLLKKLVVVDIAPRHYPPHHQSILTGLKSIDLSKVASRKEADNALKAHVKELGVRQFLLKNLGRSKAAGYEWKINLPVIDRKIENVGEALTEDYTFDKPTLFINGASSRYIQAEDEPLIYKIFPKASIKSIGGAGHWVHAEKPKEFLEILTEFVAQ